jgi:hypothetical protein
MSLIVSKLMVKEFNNIKKNHGLGALAKLMLNSFWGKFGQARLKLYSYLEQLGLRALYADTDSVVYTQGVLVVESDASHFTYGRISILIGSGNLVGIVLRSTGDKLYYSVVGHFISEIKESSCRTTARDRTDFNRVV